MYEWPKLGSIPTLLKKLMCHLLESLQRRQLLYVRRRWVGVANIASVSEAPIFGRLMDFTVAVSETKFVVQIAQGFCNSFG